MNIYSFIHSAILLTLSFEHPTTLKFNSSIEFYTVGNQHDFFTYKSKDNKILILKPKIKDFNVPLVVLTKKHTYQFVLQNGAQRSFVYQASPGSVDRIYRVKKKKKNWTILEGRHSYLIRSNKEKISVNGQILSGKKHYISKGPIVKINGIEEVAL